MNRIALNLKLNVANLQEILGLIRNQKVLSFVGLCFASLTTKRKNSMEESLFHARRVTSIITRGAGEILLLPINFCYQVLLSACLTATHRWGERSVHKISLHFIVHRLKAVSRASQSWRIDLFDRVCGEKLLLHHYKQGQATFMLSSTSRYTNQAFFFLMHLLWDFHRQKAWLDPTFLNSSTYSLSSSRSSLKCLLKANGDWEQAATRWVREDSREPDLGHRKSCLEWQAQNDIIIH